MPYKNISAAITDQAMQAIKDALTAIETNLPFLITLTDVERKALFKAGPKRLSFVENALTAAQDNPDILPKSFDAAGFAMHVALFGKLTEINTLVAQLASKLDDTRMTAGSNSMDDASDVYNYVQAAVKKTPGLKPVADQLGQLFQQAVATKAANAAAKRAALKTAKT
jgi:hypothetical protein